MKVTGTGRSSTWFKGNIFQADSRKRVFFYAVPEKHFLLISSPCRQNENMGFRTVEVTEPAELHVRSGSLLIERINFANYT